MKACGEVEVNHALVTSIVYGVCGYVHSLVALTQVTAKFTVNYSYLLLISTFFSYALKMAELFSPVTPFIELIQCYSPENSNPIFKQLFPHSRTTDQWFARTRHQKHAENLKYDFKNVKFLRFISNISSFNGVLDPLATAEYSVSWSPQCISLCINFSVSPVDGLCQLCVLCSGGGEGLVSIPLDQTVLFWLGILFYFRMLITGPDRVGPSHIHSSLPPNGSCRVVTQPSKVIAREHSSGY
jgi:hypothetical protein